MNIHDLPLSIQEKLMMVAELLPRGRRGAFLRMVGTRIHKAAADHPRTLLYGALGWVLGELVDHVATFRLPFSQVVVRLTADHASELGMAYGLFKGFTAYRRELAARRSMADVVMDCMRKSARGHHESV